MPDEQSRFTSDRRTPANSSWKGGGDWTKGIAENTEVVGEKLFGRAPEQITAQSNLYTESFEDGDASDWVIEAQGKGVSYGVDSGWATDGSCSLYQVGSRSYGTFQISRPDWQISSSTWELSLDYDYQSRIDYSTFQFWAWAGPGTYVSVIRSERDSLSSFVIAENGTTLASSSHGWAMNGTDSLALRMTDSSTEFYVNGSLDSTLNVVWENDYTVYPRIQFREISARIDNIVLQAR